MKRSDREAIHRMFDGHCAYCGTEITLKDMHADHVMAVVRKMEWTKNRDGMNTLRTTGEMWNPQYDKLENMLPSCRACNIEKSSSTLEDFRRGIARKTEVLMRNNATFRHAKRFNRITVNNEPLVFYFEKNIPEGVVYPDEWFYKYRWNGVVQSQECDNPSKRIVVKPTEGE